MIKITRHQNKSKKQKSLLVNLQYPFQVVGANEEKIISPNNLKSWRNGQNFKYSLFLDFFRVQMEQLSGKLLLNLFKQMSSFILTRNWNQCRIHHFQMLKLHNSISGIIASIFKVDFTTTERCKDLVASLRNMRKQFNKQVRMINHRANQSQRDIVQNNHQHKNIEPTINNNPPNNIVSSKTQIKLQPEQYKYDNFIVNSYNPAQNQKDNLINFKAQNQLIPSNQFTYCPYPINQYSFEGPFLVYNNSSPHNNFLLMVYPNAETAYHPNAETNGQAEPPIRNYFQDQDL